jgi:hypothetical protein
MTNRIQRSLFTFTSLKQVRSSPDVIFANHRASFDPMVNETIDPDALGVSMVSYGKMPFNYLSRPIYPVDLDMDWDREVVPHHS